MNNCWCRVELEVEEDPVVELEVEEKIVFGGGYAEYEGPYIATPKFRIQTLQTNDKHMNDDITIEAIEVSRTTNPSGGKTVYIGVEG